MNPEELPIIKVKAVRDIMYSEMDLEMGDSVHDTLVEWGKEVATEADYVRIAVSEGLINYINLKDEEAVENGQVT